MTQATYRDELIETAQQLVRKGRGILAADESNATCGKRLAGIGVKNTENNRRKYRTMLATAPGLGEFISGVILYDETLFQKASIYGVKAVDERLIIDHFRDQGIIPGIKVDTGLRSLIDTLPNAKPGEHYCSGLDGLLERAQKYYEQGARFAKWRAVLKIHGDGDDDGPSERAVVENARGLARYARIVQEAGLVPIIEPEVLQDGNHTIGRARVEQERVYKAVFDACHDDGVLLEGALLKCAMATPGAENTVEAERTPQRIAESTVGALMSSVPKELGGVVFLSGGLPEEAASVYLNEIQKIDRSGTFEKRREWNLSFSYGRALQHSALKAWGGKNIKAGQAALLARAQANSEATNCQYVAGSQPSSDEHLHVAGYIY
tara:strand:+ start:86 stop:1219 length:1134 start_codon:yes stop_codon:yes gene_type:complete